MEKEQEGIVADLFEVQPEEARRPFPYDGRELKHDWVKRIVTFDYTQVYERMRYGKVNPLTRYNYPNYNEMFPDVEGFCACGCGLETSKKFATNDCAKVTSGIYQILSGQAPYVTFIFYLYYGNKEAIICARCKEALGVDLDHRIAIKNGGGFCSLSNFNYLCHNCHTIKTREDFGWKPLSRKTNSYVRKADRDESKIVRRGPRKKKTE